MKQYIFITTFLMMLFAVTTTIGDKKSSLNLPYKKNPYKIHAVISSESNVTMLSMMPGYLKNLYVKDGSYFKEKQVLAEFDCRIPAAELEKAKAEVKLAKARQHSHKRLYSMGSASKLQLVESDADYEKAQAEEKIATKQVSDCVVLSPYSGQVTDLFVHQHETVKLHQKLFSILSSGSVVVKVFVPSDWVSWLKVDAMFKVYIKENGKSYNAVVVRMVNQVDAVSRSVKIIGIIKGDHTDLKSGKSGDAIFKGGDDGSGTK